MNMLNDVMVDGTPLDPEAIRNIRELANSLKRQIVTLNLLDGARSFVLST